MQITECDLRDRTDRLADYRGRGTERTTPAVPPERPLRTVRGCIDREYAQAADIESDQPRTHVQDGLGTPVAVSLYRCAAGTERLVIPVTEARFEQ
jgi:peptide chain release factor subunit 1